MLTLTVRAHRLRARAPHARVKLVELAAWTALLAAVGVAATVAWGSIGVAITAALVPAAAAGVVDRRTGRLPDSLVLASAIVTVGSAGASTPSAIGTVAGGAVVMASSLLVLHLASPDAMGFGDVKLAGALGGVLGIADWRLAVVVLALASGVSLVVAVVRRRVTVAFGPALVAATAVAIVTIATLGWEVPRWR